MDFTRPGRFPKYLTKVVIASFKTWFGTESRVIGSWNNSQFLHSVQGILDALFRDIGF